MCIRDSGNDQSFSLTVPFLTMLPIPYITVTDAVVEFNAKITSIDESHMEDNFKTEVDASVGGNYWFVRASVSSKTSYQKESGTSGREERTFDMHVKVEARNQDMPAGTERILTILENSISESKGKVTRLNVIKILSKSAAVVTVDTQGLDLTKITPSLDGKRLKVLVKPVPPATAVTELVTISTVTPTGFTLSKEVDDSQIGRSVEIQP